VQAAPVLDDDGHTLQLNVAAPRIVSLAPGATAMLFAAGAGAQVFGTSDYSDEPEAARRIERVGDSQSFDLERILALHPDVVVVWSGGTSAAQIDRLERVGLKVYRQHLVRLADIPDSLRRLGMMAGTQSQAQAAADTMAHTLATLQQRYAPVGTAPAGTAPAGTVPVSTTPGHTVLIQVWDHPLYTVSHAQLLSDVVRVCGYHNLYDDLPDPGPAVSLESVLRRDPDVILALGSDTSTATQWVRQWTAYPTLKAVRLGRLLPWSDQRLSRLGPSMVEATAALCEALSRPVNQPH